MTTTSIPTVSFQRKTIFPAGTTRPNSVASTIHSIDVISDVDLFCQVLLNSTLTGTSFVSTPGIPIAETSLQSDVSATAVSGGQVIYSFLSAGGGKTSSLTSKDIGLVLPGLLSITVAVRTISGTGTTSVVFRMLEQW